jgi:hypothetical protein
MREDQGARQSGDPPPAIAGTDAHADVAVHMTSRDTVGALASEHQASTPMLDNLSGLECVTPLGGERGRRPGAKFASGVEGIALLVAL